MNLQPTLAPEEGRLQTVRDLRSLLVLGAVCALFVGVVGLVVTLPAAPPIAADVVEPEPVAAEPALGA
jgi:hypothetical protein